MSTWRAKSRNAYIKQQKPKVRRAIRIMNNKLKKDQRTTLAQRDIYTYPYYLKTECSIPRYAEEFVAEHSEQRTRLVFNSETGLFSRIVTENVIVPAHYRKRVISRDTVQIKPYLKQYCTTAFRSRYKHLAVRKERHASYDRAPAEKGYYRRVAEVNWLAW